MGGTFSVGLCAVYHPSYRMCSNKSEHNGRYFGGGWWRRPVAAFFEPGGRGSPSTLLGCCVAGLVLL